MVTTVIFRCYRLKEEGKYELKASMLKMKGFRSNVKTTNKTVSLIYLKGLQINSYVFLELLSGSRHFTFS